MPNSRSLLLVAQALQRWQQLSPSPHPGQRRRKMLLPERGAIADRTRYSPANGGTFRPIELLTREGSVFHVSEPAPVGFYYEIELRVYDIMWRCLAQHMPERLAAGHFASVCGTFIGGIHPDTGRQYTVIEPQLGGWGASLAGDGNSAMYCGFHGETYNCPAEINEARNGLIVDQMALNVEPGGECRHMGGRGIVLDYRVRADDGFLTAGYTRSKFPAWGLDGGRDGSPNYIEFIPRQGERRTFAAVSGLATKKDDVIRVFTGNGGGLGDPRQRDPALVRADVRNGLITPECARDVFGAEVLDCGAAESARQINDPQADVTKGARK